MTVYSPALEEILNCAPITVTPETPLADVMARMNQLVGSHCYRQDTYSGNLDRLPAIKSSSCALVLAGDKLVGMLTERDIVALMAKGKNLTGVAIAEVMARQLICLQETEYKTVFTVLSILRQHRVRHLPVVDESGKLLGVITPGSLRKKLQPSNLLKMRTLAEVMSRDVIHAPPSTSVLDLAKLMAMHRVSCVAIAQTEERQLLRPVGIVTERDILQCQILELDVAALSAETVMSTPVFCLSPDASLWTADRQMKQKRVRRLVVTGKMGEMLGIITQTSILRPLDPIEMYEVVEILQQKVCRLEDRELELLQHQNTDLERQVERRTAELQQQYNSDCLLTQITAEIRASLNLQEILDATAEQVRKFLGCDRVIIYRFEPNWSGIVVAESVKMDRPSFLGNVIHDPCFAPHWIESYTNGRIRAIEDIYAAGMTPCHVELLEQLNIRAKVVIPIVRGGQLWGLLAAIECASARQWEHSEIDLLARLAVQVAIAIQQSELYAQAQAELRERTLVEAELRRRTRQQEVVAKLGQHALENTNLDPLIDEATKLTARTLEVKYCKVLELLPNQAVLWLRAGVGWKKGSVKQVRVSAGTKSQAGYTLQSREPAIVEDLRLETRFSGTSFLHEHHVVSGVSVIIDGKDQPFGVLSVHTVEHRTFSQDDINFLQAIANIIAAAVERQQAEEELNRFFNLSLDLFCIAGTDRYFKRINPRFQDILGHTPADLLSQPFTNFVHPDDVEATLIELEKLSLGIPTSNFENRYRCTDGTYRWFSWTGIPYGDRLIYAAARDITEQKRAATALQESERKFRQLAENLREVFYVEAIDRPEIVYISPGYEQIWGSSIESLYRNPYSWMEAVHPEDRDRLVEELQIPGGREHFNSEYRIVKPDGEIRWIWARNFPVRNDLGKVYRIAGIAEDITERKQAENLLLGQKHVLEMLATGASLPSVLNCLCRFIESLAEDFLCSVLLVDKDSDCLRHAAAPTLPEDYNRAVDGAPIGLEVGPGAAAAFLRQPIIISDLASNPVRLENSSIRWSPSAEFRNLALGYGLRACWSTPIFSAKGEVLGTFAMYARSPQVPSTKDLQLIELATQSAGIAIERKLAEIEIQQSERRFRATFEQAAVGIAHVAVDGKWLRVNQKLCDIVGYAREELLQLTFADITHPRDLNADLELIARILAGEIPTYSIEKRYLCKNGTLIWINLTVSLVRERSGVSDYLIAVVEDISDRKTAQQELHDLNQELENIVDKRTEELQAANDKLLVEIIERQQIEIEIETRARQQAIIAELGQIALSGMPLPTLIEQIVIQVARSLDVEYCKILEIDSDRPSLLTLVIGDDPIHKFALSPCPTFNSPGSPIASSLLDGKNAPLLHKHQRLNGVSVAIQGRQGCFGILGACSSKRKTFIEDDINFLQSAANLLAAAIDRSRAERALRDSQEELQDFFDNANDLIQSASLLDGHFTYVNRAWRETLGYRSEEVSELSIFEIIHPNCREEYIHLFGQLQAGLVKKINTAEIAFLTKEGSPVILEGSINCRFEAGIPTITRAIFRDITERKRVEAQIERQNLKSRLFAEISLKIRQSLQLEDILQTTVTEVQKILACDRALIYRVFPDGRGCAIAEEVLAGWPEILNICFPEEIFPLEYLQLYVCGTVKAIADVERAYGEMTPCLVEFLEQWCVRAKLVVPIVQNEQVWGLIIAHQCSGPRQWTDFEIELLQQLADQVGIAVSQAQLLEALQQSEARFRAMFEQAAVGIVQTGLDERLIAINPKFCQMVGYSSAELTGTSFAEITHPDDRESDVKSVKQLLAGEIEMLSKEKRYIRKDNSIVWVNISVSLVRKPSGDPDYLIAVVEDISDRKRVEQQLRLSERAIAASSNGIVIADANVPDLPIISVNPAFEQMTGYAAAEIVGKNCRFLQGDDTQQLELERLRSAMRAERSCTVILRNYRQDGTLFWNELTVSPIYDVNGTLTHFLGVQNDITESRQVELERRMAQERLQYLLSSSPGVLYSCQVTGDYRATFVSDNASALLGYDAEEFKAPGFWRNYLHPDDAPRISEVGLSPLFESDRYSHEYRFQHKNGRYLWIYDQLKLVRDDAGNPLEIIGYWVDISDRKRAEAELFAAKDQLQAVLDTVPGFVSWVSCDRENGTSAPLRYLGVNRHLAAAFNLTPEAFIGQEIGFLESNRGLTEFLHQFFENPQTVTDKVTLDVQINELTRHYLIVAQKYQQGTAAVSVGIDITEGKQAESKLRASLKEKELLLKEIHHRVKNNLLVVANLLEFQSDYTDDSQVVKVLEESQNRIHSMALIHEKLYRSTDLDRVNFGDYLESLVDNLSDSYLTSGQLIDFELAIEPIHLNVETAHPCGLIVNELISNIFKHAFPNTKQGQVIIGLQRHLDRQISLTVADNGIGFPEGLDFRDTDSLGLQLVCTLTEQLEGTIELIRRNGTLFQLTFSELQYRQRY